MSLQQLELEPCHAVVALIPCGLGEGRESGKISFID
jgi:hypothetical protein